MSQITTDAGKGYEFTSRIRATLPNLSPSLASVGRVLLAEPALPLRFSINEIAKKAGVSAASVTRFARQIGYDGYPALRVSAAADAGREDSHQFWTNGLDEDSEIGDDPESIMRRMLGLNLRALQTAAELTDMAALSRIAEGMLVSDRVDIYGVGTSGWVAAMSAFALYRIGINVSAWTDLHSGLTSGAMLTPRSVAIAVSNTGGTKDCIEMLELARERGALTVAITSDPTSRLARAGKILVQTYRAEDRLTTDGMSAKYAQLVVFDLIYMLVASHDPEASRQLMMTAAAAIGAHRPASAYWGKPR